MAGHSIGNWKGMLDKHPLPKSEECLSAKSHSFQSSAKRAASHPTKSDT